MAIPKALDFNQIVTLDLKQFKEGHVLWLVDGFTRFIQGIVLKNKEGTTIVDAIHDGWICRFGFPSQGFWTDNGLEF